MSFWSIKEEDASEQMARRIESFGSQSYPDSPTTAHTPANERETAVVPDLNSADDIARDVAGAVAPGTDYAVGESVIDTVALARDRFSVEGAAADRTPHRDGSGDASEALRVALERVLEDEAAKAARIAELQLEIEHLSARRDEATTLALTIQQYLADERRE